MMQLPDRIARRLRAEDGAVTIDWVVITATVVTLGMAAGALVFNTSTPLAQKIADFIGARSVNSGAP